MGITLQISRAAKTAFFFIFLFFVNSRAEARLLDKGWFKPGFGGSGAGNLPNMPNNYFFEISPSYTSYAQSLGKIFIKDRSVYAAIGGRFKLLHDILTLDLRGHYNVYSIARTPTVATPKNIKGDAIFGIGFPFFIPKGAKIRLLAGWGYQSIGNSAKTYGVVTGVGPIVGLDYRKVPKRNRPFEFQITYMPYYLDSIKNSRDITFTFIYQLSNPRTPTAPLDFLFRYTDSQLESGTVGTDNTFNMKMYQFGIRFHFTPRF